MSADLSLGGVCGYGCAVTMTSRPDKSALSAARRRKIFAWALWDWGTQPFSTIVTTFVFAIYITGPEFGTENETNLALSWSTGIAGFLIAALAPVMGQNSDLLGGRMKALRQATWGLALVCAALFLIKPEPGYLVPGLALMGIGAVVSEIGNVNYYALLEDLTTPKSVGRVSGLGWGMGYLGGIISLVAINSLFIAPEQGLFGVSSEGGLDIRVSMLLCAVWTAVFTTPLFIAMRDQPQSGTKKRIRVGQSYRRLFSSVRELWRNDRQTAYFLLASALFRDGLAGVFAFGAVIAKVSFNMSASEVITFGVAANVIAGVATIGFGYVDGWIGAKPVILISLISMVFAGTAIFWVGHGVATGTIDPATGTASFWILGLILTVFVGPAQAASRSFLTQITPEGRSGELFGLYATTGRAVSFFSPTAYGMAIYLGAKLTGSNATQYWGILGIVMVLGIGTIFMGLVKKPAPRPEPVLA